MTASTSGGAAPKDPEYFAVCVANAEAVEKRDDIRFPEPGRLTTLDVDSDARFNTGPNGARLDTEELAKMFLAHALPVARARHGAPVELQVARRRATTSMAARWSGTTRGRFGPCWAWAIRRNRIASPEQALARFFIPGPLARRTGRSSAATE
ncbi:hypothetical protein [Paraburkholderia sp. RL17-347-BIC-D]|uniref:hypothetical protein n=1 Tax=Paraburkholderia sp. RL17-347-BIC-D TaxID=3031632 RepID=UPI0038BA5DB7